MSGCSSMSKAYKFTVDPGYLHDIKGNVNWLNNFLLSIVTRGNSIIFHSFTYFFTNYRRRKSEFKLLSINEKERATPHLGVSWKGCLGRGVFQENWWVLVWKMFLRSWSRWILPSCDRTSLLPCTCKASTASYSARRTDMHQHETVLEYSKRKENWAERNTKFVW